MREGRRHSSRVRTEPGATAVQPQAQSRRSPQELPGWKEPPGSQGGAQPAPGCGRMMSIAAATRLVIILPGGHRASGLNPCRLPPALSPRRPRPLILVYPLCFPCSASPGDLLGCSCPPGAGPCEPAPRGEGRAESPGAGRGSPPLVTVPTLPSAEPTVGACSR